MNRFPLMLIALLAASALLLSACGTGSGSGSLTASLAGTSWKLVSYGPVSSPVNAVADVETSLVFGTDGTVGGSLGCNSFGGKYEEKDGSVTFSEIISTMMACTDESRMAQEQAAFQVLNGSDTYTIKGETLTILDAAGENALTLSSVPG